MPVTKGIGSGRSALLTFDDGPEPVTALDSILQTLSRNSVLGEFYVIGMEVKSSPTRARSIVDAGHKIQNHSWSHINLQTAPESSVREQVRKTQEIVREATGVTPTKLRRYRGLEDTSGIGAPKVARVREEMAKKSAHRMVVLMHVQPATARDLRQFIETLKGWGFAFARP